MKSGIGYIENAINEAILSIHTAYIAEVLSVKNNKARLQPLTVHKAKGGTVEKQAPTEAFIPKNIKTKTETITYMISETMSETKDVIVPSDLAVGDIVYVGVCDRDISNAIKGEIREATPRHHNINDGVILRVL